MANGANGVHLQLREALENYIKSQYFGKSPVLLSATHDKLSQEGVLYQKPYVESSPAYKSLTNGIQLSKVLPDWMKDYFQALSKANLGVYPSPFCHQISALEAAVDGQDLFVSTGTGSGKTECFMWPLMAKLASEARNQPDSWSMRGVRTIVMYPMNALVSDQISRLRRLIGDPEHRFVNIFRDTCGVNSRRPQFGMYTGRTPYAGKEPRRSEDQALAATYSRMVNPQTEEEKVFLSKLIKDGKLPAKEDFDDFLQKLYLGKHIPNDEDAELVTRFEMQQFCPDILITNYSMLEYMLLRPREDKIWSDTKSWLNADPSNRLLFVIDEAHMYRGSAGGEVSLLIRRLFNHLGIDRSKVQFILTTASMPDNNDDDKKAVMTFANELTASDDMHQFCYLTGEREKIGNDKNFDIPFLRFIESVPDEFEGDDPDRLTALNRFWDGIDNCSAPFESSEDAYQWLYDHLVDYTSFRKMFEKCRGSAVSLQELAEFIFPNNSIADALLAISVMLAIAPLARSSSGSVLFPARMHMLFRGIKGVYACTNPNCSHAHTENGLTLGEVYFSDGNFTCKECGSTIYELYNDRRCGSVFFRGFVLKCDFELKKRTYLWRQSGMMNEEELREIHLFIPEASYKPPEKQGQNKILPCYLDVNSGFIDFSDDSLEGKPGIRKLYYSEFTAKARPDIITFATCPHCRHELSKMQLTSFSTRGNLSFYNLVQAQFRAQPAVPGKTSDPNRLPNEGRKVLLFSDSRQRAAKLARDMSDASDMTASRQLAILAIDRMEQEDSEQSMNCLYDYFAMVAVENYVQIFHDSETEKQRSRLKEHGGQSLKNYNRAKRRNLEYKPRYTIDNAPTQMKEQVLRLYCGGYNTLVDSALSWIEPTDAAKWDAIDALEELGVEVTEDEFMDFFNAWILSVCDTSVVLGHTISDAVRQKVRPNYVGYGIDKDKKFSTAIKEIMGWKDNDPIAIKWSKVLRETFMDEGASSNGKYYVDLSRVKPRFDLNHTWYRCEQCSELTPYLLRGKCPSCQCERVHSMTESEFEALGFWRKPIEDALDGEIIRVIDTEEHTAQLSHKDQRDELWSRTEQYELRFQDFLQTDESPVDILSSTTTMEVGIDIGSLVAVGLRNIPPMRENYQQRAGRAGRRGSSLSTIVTFCEDGPHDSLYFSNPIPMFRGDPRKPWIDMKSEKIVQRHLGMVALQSYLRLRNNSLDAISAVDFLDNHLTSFLGYLDSFDIPTRSVLVPISAQCALKSYKEVLGNSLVDLKQKRDAHPELFETDDNSDNGKKSLLDALYEEGIIPTYSFPKNVVSTYITDMGGKIKYQVERGLDVAIGEYAPGRAIVVDKTTYQIGGLYCPGSGLSESAAASPARSFINDASYRKPIRKCEQCGWFGLEEDNYDTCPFCGNDTLTNMLPMLRPWGFAPRNATSIETAQLTEEYTAIQQPLYSTLPDADDVTSVDGCTNIRMAVRPNQRIIMLNKGTGNTGFTICCDCGAAMPGNDADVLKDVLRPYRSKFNRTRCKHTDTDNVNLGYDFVTDMLVLEFALDSRMIDVNTQKNSWLNRAGQSLAEALRLASCKELDIEFTELVTGYRIRRSLNGDFIDIYLYDSLSSGAGYAVSIESSIRTLLEKTKELLANCDCDSACHKCLKHYRNQYIHGSLDRKAALELLAWGELGVREQAIPIHKQKRLLKTLGQVLLISGVNIDFSNDYVLVEGRFNKKKVVIYPAMWVRPVADDTIFVSDAHLKYAKPYALKTIVECL